MRGNPARRWGEYVPPDYCDICGAPHPWLSREGRLYLLHHLLDDAELDEPRRLRAREQLVALADASLAPPERERRLARLRTLAPGVWSAEQAQRVLSTL